jgi:hypothetical protein
MERFRHSSRGFICEQGLRSLRFEHRSIADYTDGADGWGESRSHLRDRRNPRLKIFLRLGEIELFKTLGAFKDSIRRTAWPYSN